MSSIEPVEPGYGHIAPPETRNTSLDEATGSSPAAADGGEVESLHEVVRRVIDDTGPCTAAQAYGEVADRGYDFELEDVRDAADALAADGRIADFSDGYETVE